MNRNAEERDKEDMLFGQQLELQEQMILNYHAQLICAHTHFEYAKVCGKGSEGWKSHMKKAEEECDVFEHSSKSLHYIEEQFRMLKNSIDMEYGTMPEEVDETGKIDVEVDKV